MSDVAAPSSDAASALCVVLDCDPAAWARQPTELIHAVDQTLIFLNAFQMLGAGNQLLVLGAHPTAVERLWPPPSAGADAASAASSTHGLRDAVIDGVQLLAVRSPPDEGGAAPPPLLSAALTSGMCRLQRTRRARPKSEARVFILHASADAPSQHLATMNVVFAAQRLGVLIDAVLLCQPHDSMLLQQATHLTGGVYLRPDAPTQTALAQYLLTACLPDRYARQYLRAPAQAQPETRALCFLSKQPVEVGYACSVCLAVFSHDHLPSCPVCATRFSLALPAGAGKKKVLKKPKPASAAGGGSAAAPAPAAPPPPNFEGLSAALGDGSRF